MEVLRIEPTNLSPLINFDPESGRLELTGRSIPENSLEFYQSVYEWLDEYVTNPKDKTVVEVKLDYFNTSSSKCILDILKKVDKLEDAGHDVLINWYYNENDEDMMEAGEDYGDLLDSPFDLISM